MESVQITCPFCWQGFDIEAPSYQSQAVVFTTDCEVCCRPMVVTFTWDEEGDEPFVEVEAEG